MTLKTSFGYKPTLTGELVVLRPVEAADAAGLHAVDPETMRLTGSNRDSDFTLDNLQSWYATRGTHDDRLDLSIIERATGEWAGDARSCLSPVEPPSGCRCRLPE